MCESKNEVSCCSYMEWEVIVDKNFFPFDTIILHTHLHKFTFTVDSYFIFLLGCINLNCKNIGPSQIFDFPECTQCTFRTLKSFIEKNQDPKHNSSHMLSKGAYVHIHIHMFILTYVHNHTQNTYAEGHLDKNKNNVSGRSNLSQVEGLYVYKFRYKPPTPCISFSMYVILITRLLKPKQSTRSSTLQFVCFYQ